jgi:hypothetical protein
MTILKSLPVALIFHEFLAQSGPDCAVQSTKYKAALKRVQKRGAGCQPAFFASRAVRNPHFLAPRAVPTPPHGRRSDSFLPPSVLRIRHLFSTCRLFGGEIRRSRAQKYSSFFYFFSLDSCRNAFIIT